MIRAPDANIGTILFFHLRDILLFLFLLPLYNTGCVFVIVLREGASNDALCKSKLRKWDKTLRDVRSHLRGKTNLEVEAGIYRW